MLSVNMRVGIDYFTWQSLTADQENREGKVNLDHDYDTLMRVLGFLYTRQFKVSASPEKLVIEIMNAFVLALLFDIPALQTACILGYQEYGMILTLESPTNLEAFSTAVKMLYDNTADPRSQMRQVVLAHARTRLAELPVPVPESSKAIWIAIYRNLPEFALEIQLCAQHITAAILSSWRCSKQTCRGVVAVHEALSLQAVVFCPYCGFGAPLSEYTRAEE
jgi:hypothetical protein